MMRNDESAVSIHCNNYLLKLNRQEFIIYLQENQWVLV